MTETYLGGLSRYERRMRALWSAEPQRGDYHESDDDARTALAAECALNGLNHWATVMGAEPCELPTTVGAFAYCVQWFNILGVQVLAFPGAEQRDAFVKVNSERAEAVADDLYWPA